MVLSIGLVASILADNPFVAAPMDGYSDLPFRTVCRRMGAGLCFTEMIPAIALCFSARDAKRRMRIGHGDRPIIVQIEGASPEVMARAAVIVEAGGADMIDVNAGCPSRRVTNGGAGSALLSDLPLLERILKAVKGAVKVPVTLKVRSGPTVGNFVIEDVARIAVDCGIEALTLHPRTRTQGYRGNADWNHITKLKSLVTIPVIGNGDVTNAELGVRMLRETGCDGVMVGRGTVGNPWIFRELLAAWKGRPVPARPDHDEWRTTVMSHFDMMVEYLGDDSALAAKLFRKHLSRYTRGMRGAVALRRSLPGVVTRGTLVNAVNQILADEDAPLPEGVLPIDDGPGEFEMEACG